MQKLSDLKDRKVLSVAVDSEYDVLVYDQHDPYQLHHDNRRQLTGRSERGETQRWWEELFHHEESMALLLSLTPNLRRSGSQYPLF